MNTPNITTLHQVIADAVSRRLVVDVTEDCSVAFFKGDSHLTILFSGPPRAPADFNLDLERIVDELLGVPPKKRNRK